VKDPVNYSRRFGLDAVNYSVCLFVCIPLTGQPVTIVMVDACMHLLLAEVFFALFASKQQ
jgi:hypothetical protein